MAEGFAVALEDQAQGAEQVKQAAKAFAQQAFDATAGAGFGALGGATTMTGAVLGGVKGATVGTLEGAKEIVDAGADVAYSMTKEASKGGAEVARRVLRRPEEEA
jgi:precorrin-6B methylase 2